MEQHRRTLRFLHAAMLGAAVLYVWLPEKVTIQKQEAISREMYLIVVAMAAMSVGGVFFVRQAMVIVVGRFSSIIPKIVRR